MPSDQSKYTVQVSMPAKTHAARSGRRAQLRRPSAIAARMNARIPATPATRSDACQLNEELPAAHAPSAPQTMTTPARTQVVVGLTIGPTVAVIIVGPG